MPVRFSFHPVLISYFSNSLPNVKLISKSSKNINVLSIAHFFVFYVLCGWYTEKCLHFSFVPSSFYCFIASHNVINLSTQKIWMIFNIHGSVKVTLRHVVVVTLISLELRFWVTCFPLALCFTQLASNTGIRYHL